MQNYEFKVGDKVKVTAHPSGDNDKYDGTQGFDNTWVPEMDGAVGNVYTIEEVRSRDGVYFSEEPFGYDYGFPPAALELVKENESMNTETQFQVGDTVWCILNGRGKVISIDNHGDYSIEVGFGNYNVETYTQDGKFYTFNVNRSLYFSEPKIEGETTRPFQPKLIGKSVVVKSALGNWIGKVIQEDSIIIQLENSQCFVKSKIEIFELGPEIKL